MNLPACRTRDQSTDRQTRPISRPPTPARAGRPCRLHVSFAVEISTTNEAARHGAASRTPR
ncbi:hypothetical protein CFB50_17135 [Burkholderia sp. AU33423]|nr:hypothetical protein CFB50_17135 [Burkholderia sp. AU33423]